MLPQINIQGLLYDHTSVRVNFSGDGVIVPPNVQNFIKSINWGHGVESARVHGIQVTPLGGTLGPYTATLEMSIIKEGWDLLQSVLPYGYMGYVFQAISISFINPLAVIPAVTNIFGCRIMKEECSSSQGGKEIEVKLTFIVTGLIQENMTSPIPIDQDLIGL